jgi:hypothetical protein
MRRVVLAAAVAFALASVAGGSAQAAPPTIEHFDFVGVDEEFSDVLTEACSFPVTVFVEEHTTSRIYADGSERATINFRATYTSPTTTLNERDHYQFFLDAGQETARFTGIPFELRDADGNVIFKDRGIVIFDADGNILVEHGPHPSLHDDSEFGICGDLS